MSDAPREMLCLVRVTGGWCVLLDGHEGKCRRYPRMPIVDLGDAAAALDRIFAKGRR